MNWSVITTGTYLPDVASLWAFPSISGQSTDFLNSYLERQKALSGSIMMRILNHILDRPSFWKDK
jgi:hypothetical protein